MRFASATTIAKLNITTCPHNHTRLLHKTDEKLLALSNFSPLRVLCNYMPKIGFWQASRVIVSIIVIMWVYEALVYFRVGVKVSTFYFCHTGSPQKPASPHFTHVLRVRINDRLK